MKNTVIKFKSRELRLEAKRKAEPQISEFLTCPQAAKQLCLSTTTIHKMVKNNSLQAWKTPGGHRRIFLASVLNYQTLKSPSKQAFAPSSRLYKLVLVIESSLLFKQFAKEATQWPPSLKVSIFKTLPDALLELFDQKHDLFILQMNSPRQQQEKVLEILQKFMDSQQMLAHTLILTHETDLLPPSRHGGSTGGIQVVNNDLSLSWLSAYLAGFLAPRRN